MLDDIFKILGKVIPDTNQAEKIKADIQKSYDDALTKAVEADKEIRLAELESDSWLQRSWRPISALIVFSAIFVRYPLYHLAKLIVGWFDLDVYLPELEGLPENFYFLATAFISIYAFGRTQEKRFRK